MTAPEAKLSPYTLSLIGSSPPSLPHVPTLKELRERADAVPTYNSSRPPLQPQYMAQRRMSGSQSPQNHCGSGGKEFRKSSESYAGTLKEPQPAIEDVRSSSSSASNKSWISWITCGAF